MISKIYSRVLFASFCICAASCIWAQTPAQSWQPPVLPPDVPNLYAKQGYPKEQSAAMLDVEVRQLLDVALRLYREPGLFSNRSKALEALGVRQTSRWYNSIPAVVSGHRSYVDTFTTGSFFEQPAWTGEYRYNGKREDRMEAWHALILISVDRKIECINSRAVEGYLDLTLSPDGTRSPHWNGRDRTRRHDVILGKSSAPALSSTTPALILTFSDGCLSELTIVKTFNFKDISDDNANN